MRAASAVLLCLCASVSAARAQGDEDPVERVETNLVQLNVGVADRRGRAITDLTLGDFAVYEDGVRQQITSFEPVHSPFSLVVLLDLSGSTLSFRTTLVQSALRFIDALAPDDRVAVISFNDKVKTRQSFTTDRKKIAEAISSVSSGDRGGTNFYSGLRYALGEIAKEGTRRKAIVVLTDGVDTEQRKNDTTVALKATTDADAVASIDPAASEPLRAVLDMADRQGVTIYPLALPSGDAKRLLAPTPQQVAVYAAARARMQSIADRTGGRLHEIRRLEELGRLYAEVAADMRTLYTIAYQPTGDRRRDGSWRAIQIQVSRADLIARTRPGYFAR